MAAERELIPNLMPKEAVIERNDGRIGFLVDDYENFLVSFVLVIKKSKVHECYRVSSRNSEVLK